MWNRTVRTTSAHQQRFDDDLHGFPTTLLLLAGVTAALGGLQGRFDHSGLGARLLLIFC